MTLQSIVLVALAGYGLVRVVEDLAKHCLVSFMFREATIRRLVQERKGPAK